MSVVSELSMLELYAERGELLPEREPLSTIGGIKVTQVAVTAGHVSNTGGVPVTGGVPADQSISQTSTITSSPSIDETFTLTPVYVLPASVGAS